MTDEDKELGKRIVRFLNDFLEDDREAITALVETRVPCNEFIANHTTIQAGLGENLGVDSKYVVGLLGVLNGLVGSYEVGEYEGWGCISAVYDNDTGELLEFLFLEQEK